VLGQIVSVHSFARTESLTFDLVSGFSSLEAHLAWWRRSLTLFPFTRLRRPSMLNGLLKDSWARHLVRPFHIRKIFFHGRVRSPDWPAPSPMVTRPLRNLLGPSGISPSHSPVGVPTLPDMTCR
jgi:hypothetical protein